MTRNKLRYCGDEVRDYVSIDTLDVVSKPTLRLETSRAPRIVIVILRREVELEEFLYFAALVLGIAQEAPVFHFS